MRNLREAAFVHNVLGRVAMKTYHGCNKEKPSGNWRDPSGFAAREREPGIGMVASLSIGFCVACFLQPHNYALLLFSIMQI